MVARIPYYSTASCKRKSIKHHLKQIADLKDWKAVSRSVSGAPANFIKTICNFPLNVLRGDVQLKPKYRPILKKNRKLIENLVDNAKSLETKRKLLSQKGGSILLTALIGIALPIITNLLGGKR